MTQPPINIRSSIALVALLLAACSLLLLVVNQLALGHGGGVDAQQLRRGMASDVRCSRSLLTLQAYWTCTASRIEWDAASVPAQFARVRLQNSPYYILAKRELSGALLVAVHSHPPSNWRTSGWRSGQPSEIIVAQEYPVGSSAWTAFQAFGPAVIVVVALLMAWMFWLRHSCPRKRRRA